MTVKIDVSIVLVILRMVLCNDKMLTWLKEQAKKSDTPIDDTGVRILELILCEGE